jgi:hypothetical protein
MSGTDMTAPTLAALQAALYKTTETLARELARPSDIAPDWSESEWLVARAVASLHGVSPLLCRTLRWQGPAGWARFLGEQSAHTLNRHRRIQQLLALIDSRARDDGVPLVALKGAALHAVGLYEAGERPMADVDLLAREEDMQRTARLLEALGFHETLVTWKHRVFEPNECRAPASFGEHADNGMKIELHSRTKEILPVRAADVTQIVFPRLPHAGLNDYPSTAALLSHLLLHAAGAMSFHGIRLLHLHDIAQLSARMIDADWDEFLGSEASGGTLWWAFPPLALTARYYSSIPQRVLVGTAAVCPWLLKEVSQRQTLSDVSQSRLWVSAFPGIEWTQSIREMLMHARGRLAPSAETLAARKYVVKTQPAHAAISWGSMSQSRRILRWMMGRPARPDTLFAVRSALAQSP